MHLVGYPREDICDPSYLSLRELLTLRESLEKGTCSFQPLPDADREALQLVVDEQERMGENPWGKRKRRNDAGKPKKKRTVRLGSTDSHPPFRSSLGNETQVEMNSDNSDIDDTPNGDTSHVNRTGQPRPVIRKRTLKVANPTAVHANTSAASASSSAHRAGPPARPAHPRSVTPVLGVKTRAGVEHTCGDGSKQLHDGLGARRSGRYEDYSSGEEEVDLDTYLERSLRWSDDTPGDEHSASNQELDNA